MALTYRNVKGTELSHAELDGNFSELDARTAIRWQNLNGEVNVGATAPPTYVEYKGIPLRTFSPNEVQQVSVQFHMPHDLAGNDIVMHAHVVSEFASTGTVRWGFEYNHAGEWMTGDPAPTVNQKFGASTTVYGENMKTADDQDLHRILLAPLVTIDNLLADDIILCRFFRDATHINDTYPDPVHLMYVDIYYQSQGFGSVGY